MFFYYLILLNIFSFQMLKSIKSEKLGNTNISVVTPYQYLLLLPALVAADITNKSTDISSQLYEILIFFFINIL